MSHPQQFSDPQIYTVGWICAISTEFTAAKAFLEEQHARPSVVAQNHNNNYALGAIGGHNIVIAVLPNGEYGIASAAIVARDMLHSFPNVRIGLMVGIGGGAPSPRQDIRLGDIVVSSRHGGRGGIFQYDFGKAVQNQDDSFQHTGHLNQPPTVLRTAVEALESHYEMEGHTLSADVDKALQLRKRLQNKFSRPSPSSDRLYLSTVIHPNSPGTCESLCGDDPTLLISRNQRGGEEDDPKVHYGLIASANQLVKDSKLRDKLATDHGVLCFEMEAAGLINHFPCLVVRGICDYSDSHKNKDWQGFAAMMAAAYTSDLLRQITPTEVEAERRLSAVLDSLQEDVAFLRQDVHEIKVATVTLENDQRISSFHHWLSPADPSVNTNTARSQRHNQSGTWFLEGAVFDEWKKGIRRHLWLHGMAGWGKTILCSTIIDSLDNDETSRTIRFFFDFNDTRKQTLDSLVRSLVWQLSRIEEGTMSELNKLYEACDKGRNQPDIYNLSRCLQSMMQLLPRINVVVDAMDECTTRNDLLCWMEDLVNRPSLTAVKLIVTGRPESDLLQRLCSLFGAYNCISLDKQAIDKDISSYVNARLGWDPRFTSKRIPQDLIDQICLRVGHGADGMFRWATCQLDNLATCDSSRSIKDALNDLPQDLNETYRRTLQDLKPELRHKGIRLLRFLVYADKPLTVADAKDVVATQIETVPHHFDIERRLFVDEDLLRYYPGLIMITTSSYVDWNSKGYPSKRTMEREVKEVHLAHFSVKEYLLREHEFQIMTASVYMVKVCLAYLKDSHFGRIDRPFTEQATEILFNYARLAEACDDVVEGILSLFRDDRSMELFQRYLDIINADNCSSPTVYFASKAGLPRVLRSLLKERVSAGLDSPLEGNEWALDAATSKGHQEIIEVLLENGASPNGSGEPSPLSVASRNGQEGIVKLLLDHGADVHSGVDFTQRLDPLVAAAENGHIKIVNLLIDRGANVLTSRNKFNEDALLVAAANGDEDALLVAAANGDEDMVKLLLGHGAGESTDDDVHSLALHIASSNGNQTIVSLLLEGCVEFPPAHFQEDHPLYAASRSGHEKVVKLLLDHSDRLHIDSNCIQFTLAALSGNDQENIRKLLVVHSAKLATDSCQAQRPSLCFATMKGDKATVELLLQGGANPNTHEEMDGVVRFVLASAACAGNEEIVQVLLDNGADINAVDGSGETAVYKAVVGQHCGVVRILLDRGADVSVGASPMEYCVKHDLADMQKLIVGRAPRADTEWIIC
ncbi:nacht and ankyrin domain protein [Colletotrichum kahawae]|uniref:Nacht and ankyrin domain protein n=1 Tax=Colletotrichum kahawae TaxID=34407 RepID=A0AAE0DCU1_COLKA|nr:nacht and ankyrin domain protein [Colletotrichum kahawae]